MTAPTRDAYAWPGGYPLFYVTADGGTLCPVCANMADREGLTDDPTDPQWFIVGTDANYEDPALFCDHCAERIESAYADDDDDEIAHQDFHRTMGGAPCTAK